MRFCLAPFTEVFITARRRVLFVYIFMEKPTVIDLKELLPSFVNSYTFFSGKVNVRDIIKVEIRNDFPFLLVEVWAKNSCPEFNTYIPECYIHAGLSPVEFAFNLQGHGDSNKAFLEAKRCVHQVNLLIDSA